MAELKTRKTGASVEDFINGLMSEQTKEDCREIVKMMKRVTNAEPEMWGAYIVGFGSRMIQYASGRELDWPIIGFSPRKQYLTLYLPGNFRQNTDLLNDLGKFKTSKGCLYIKTLKDINSRLLEELIQRSVKQATEKSAAD